MFLRICNPMVLNWGFVIPSFVLLFLHHLVRIVLPVLKSHFHEILSYRKALQIHTFQTIGLSAHQAALQIVELDLGGLHIGRVLQIEPVLGSVGVEHVRAEKDIGLGDVVNVAIMDKNVKQFIMRRTVYFTTNHKTITR